MAYRGQNTIDWLKVTQKTSNQLSNVVYFDQFLGAAHTQKLVETFFQPFLNFFVHFKAFSVKNQQKKDNFGVPPQGVNQL